MEYDKHLQGSYTSDGNERDLELPFIPDHFELIDQSQWGDATAVSNIKSEWYRGQADGAALGWTQVITTNALASEAVSANGYTLLDSSQNQLGAPLAASAITAAAPPVVSMADTSGLANGDVVLVQGSTGMLQVAGLPFTIGSLIANTSIELSYMDAAGFAAPATAGVIRKINFPNRYLPKLRNIVSISQAASAVVVFSADHGYSVGQQLRLSVPAEFGMGEANGLQGLVTAINAGANSVTLDINSSSFSAFAYPTSAVAGSGVSFASAQPIGGVADSFVSAFGDNDFKGLRIGSAVVGEAASVMRWKASRAAGLQND